MSVSKKPAQQGVVRPIDQVRTQPVKILIQAGGRTVSVEGEVNPIHGDWLWDLLNVPEAERTNLLEIEVPASVLRLHRRR